MKLIALDTETTGFSRVFDRIIEIGCVDFTNGIDKKIIFQQYINPQCHVSAGAVAVHGLKEEFLNKFETFEKYALNFLKFIDGATLIIHNASFDISFLNAELKRHGFDELKNEVIDTLKLARVMFPGKKATLDALQDYFDIRIRRELHGALLDAEILTHVYLAMQTKQVNLKITTQTQQYNKIEPSAQIIEISEQELKLHKHFTSGCYDS